GKGPFLIFAHGLSSNRQVTKAQFETLADIYTIVVFDQRGHGDSTPVNDPSFYDPSIMAEDIAAVMNSLGIEKAVVGGESMGAATALLFALYYPHRVEKLLLTAPAFADKLNADQDRIKTMGRRIEEVGLSKYLEESAEKMRTEWELPQVAIDFIVEMQRVHNGPSLAVACKKVIDWIILQDLHSLKKLPFPVCIIGWPEDTLHPLDLAKSFTEIIPNAQLETIPSVVDMFSDPQIIGRIYRDFLHSL
ncbi:MAG: alpha/beta hydrolase, partial [Spirochaetales bacterium]|nr:alpha/beta hydrolase [Spirochaetales bacterium]